MANRTVDDGQVFVCGACGKMSNDLYGEVPISPHWDESCMMNAILCNVNFLVIKDGLVVEIKNGGIIEDMQKHKDHNAKDS